MCNGIYTVSNLYMEVEMKILITGAKGQLGSQLVYILKNKSNELGDLSDTIKNSTFIAKTSKELDITNMNQVLYTLKKHKPDIVINAAAFTNVNACETQKELAFSVNTFGAKNLAIACNEIDAKLLHISTDYVFNGRQNSPYKETDLTDPLSIYGLSKNIGDEFIKVFSSKYFILRTSWVYGYYGNNFVNAIIHSAKSSPFLHVVNDQVGNPTNVEDLAYHILKIILTDNYGIYHCSGKGECSRYEFAKKIIELSNISCEIIPCCTDDYPSPAKRPMYSSLDNTKLHTTIENKMRSWDAALDVYIKTLPKRIYN